MNAAHFVITTKPGKVSFRGAFLPSLGAPRSDLIALRFSSRALRLISNHYFLRLGSRLNELSFDDGDAIRSLDELCSFLDTWAAPGYEFTAWIIQGRKVWGWFPREG
jgi:hypothetical protein